MSIERVISTVGRLSGRRCTVRALCLAAAVSPAGGTGAALAACEVHEREKLTATTPVTGSWFGRVVDLSGDVAVAGAVIGDVGGTGSAFVFRRTDSGWVEEAELSACSVAECGAGQAVAVSGDVVLVGARGDFVGDGFATRLYRHSAETWRHEATFSGTWIQEAIGVDGNVAVLSTYSDWPGEEAAQPQVEIHRYEDGAWSRETELSLNATSVSISGDVILIGVAGSACVYRYDGSMWNEEAELTAADGAAGHDFACSVSVSGDVALIGADRSDDDDGEPGAAYVYRYADGTWSQEARLAASGDEDETFGQAVAVSGALAVIGADGGAFVFRYDGTAWEEQAELLPSDAPVDGFGASVAADGDMVLVGAYGGTGAVYVFCGMSDCNENSVLDACDIAAGASADANGNGVPDECEATPDDGTSDDSTSENADNLLPPCCGTGVCGAGAAGCLPFTLLGMMALKRFAVRAWH
jgi:hypothetical protein